MIYLDNAATSFPKPQAVADAVYRAVTVYGGNPGRSGHAMAIEAARQVFLCREALARLLGCDEEKIIFTYNCTHALNLAISGAVPRGCEVLTTPYEHNSVSRPLWRLSKTRGITQRTFPVFEGDPARTAAAFERAITPRTRVAVLSHASNVFGIVTPIELLAPIARRRGIRVIVDAAQTAGVLDVGALCRAADVICMPGHKGLLGPTGTGVLAVLSDISLQPMLQGGTGSRSSDMDMPESYPDRLEAGTVGTVGIIGLAAGVNAVLRRGVAQIYSHELRRTAAIYDALRATPGVVLYTARPESGTHCPVLSFNIRGRQSEEVVAELGDMGFALRGGLHCAPTAHSMMGTSQTGAVRVSPGQSTTEDDAAKFAAAVKKLAAGAP